VFRGDTLTAVTVRPALQAGSETAKSIYNRQTCSFPHQWLKHFAKLIETQIVKTETFLFLINTFAKTHSMLAKS
jgi:hypothetical protein